MTDYEKLIEEVRRTYDERKCVCSDCDVNGCYGCLECMFGPTGPGARAAPQGETK